MQSIALLVQDGLEPFGFGAMCEVFGEGHHPEDDNPVFDFRICSPHAEVKGALGFSLSAEHGLEAAADADLVILSPKQDFLDNHPAVLDVVRAAHARGATVMAHCTGTFGLAQAGVLDGRRATTHWRYTDRLAELFPEIEVVPEVLYVHDDRVLTGAGSAAGLDAALHLLRQTHGAKVAADAARRIVLPPHRDGGQAQFIRQPMPDCQADTLGPLLTWIVDNLGADLSVASLAARAAMSERNFARRFVEETGATPHQWINHQRVRVAEEMLERSDASVEHIAGRVGFGSAATFRHQFTKARGVSPQTYRRQFAC